MSKSELRSEKYELPGSTDGICSLIREVLNGGHVKRIEIDTDDTFVRAQRYTSDVGLSESQIDWDGALRNISDLREYYSDGATSYQILVDMMLLPQSYGVHGVCWAVGLGGDKLLRKWLEIDGRELPLGNISYLMGVPLQVLKSLPEETLILCCSKYPSADPSEVSVAIKTAMELGRDHDKPSNEASSGGGNHPKEHPHGAVQLAITSTGLRRVAWNPPSETGHE